jgi:hypothetical protein
MLLQTIPDMPPDAGMAPPVSMIEKQLDYLAGVVGRLEEHMIDPRDFGRVEAEVKSLQTQMSDVAEKVDRLVELASQGKGGINTLWAVGGVVAGVLGWIGVDRIFK